MDIFQTVFCVVSALSIINCGIVLVFLSCNLIQKVYNSALFSLFRLFIQSTLSIINCGIVLVFLSCNLIQKVYKNCLLHGMKLEEKMNKIQFSRITVIPRVLISVLPITSTILWLLVFYYSTFDDTKAAVLSYLGCTSIIFTTKDVFVKNTNLVPLQFLNYLAFFFIIAGCLLLFKFYTMAFYAVCLGILLNKMKYDVEQIRPDYVFEDTEVSHGNFEDPQDLTDEKMKEDSIMCFGDSKDKEQSIGNTESIINDEAETDQNGVTEEKEENIFNSIDESELLVVQNKVQLDQNYQNESNEDTPNVYSGDKFWENMIFQNGKFQQNVSNKVDNVITSNTSRENNFNRILGKIKSLNSNESLAYNRQQMIDKVCEDIKSKIECRNIQVQTDHAVETEETEETDELCLFLKQLSATLCRLNIPPCITDNSDQLSPQYSGDMIKTSPNKCSEQECFNLYDFPTSNEQFEYESESSVKFKRMQKFGKDSSSINPSLIEPEAKSTFTTDFECYSNSHVKQVTNLEKQSENKNSDFVIDEKIDESATIASANVRVTLCPSAISNVEGIVNTIDISFIYAVGPSFPY